MDVRGRLQLAGTAFVNKGEPSATDMAHLRRNLTDDQKRTLRRIVAREVRSGFGPTVGAEGDG
ncbi:hypothetical protein [Actinoplanes friuliensis]|uniref:hypothetical protein n=1 Tax=Actinoplanes friuliensis TaxID=196914 RepID=UPI0011DE20D5|nr:hypothetical protein [Actinoplanes friuliensis]